MKPGTLHAKGESMESIFGKSVCFTGDLAGMSRGRASALVREKGGRPTTEVRQADLVVAGQFPGSRLVAARARGIRVVGEVSFRELVGA